MSGWPRRQPGRGATRTSAGDRPSRPAEGVIAVISRVLALASTALLLAACGGRVGVRPTSTPTASRNVIDVPPPSGTPLADDPLRFAAPLPDSFRGAVLNRTPVGLPECQPGWRTVIRSEWGYGFCFPQSVEDVTELEGDHWGGNPDALRIGPVRDTVRDPIWGLPLACEAARTIQGKLVLGEQRHERLAGKQYAVCYRVNETNEQAGPYRWFDGHVDVFFVLPNGLVVDLSLKICPAALPRDLALSRRPELADPRYHCLGDELRRYVGLDLATTVRALPPDLALTPTPPQLSATPVTPPRAPYLLEPPNTLEMNGARMNPLPRGPLDCPTGWRAIRHLEWGYGFCMPPKAYLRSLGSAADYFDVRPGAATAMFPTGFSIGLLSHDPTGPGCRDIDSGPGYDGRPHISYGRPFEETYGGATVGVCYGARHAEGGMAQVGYYGAYFVIPGGLVLEASGELCPATLHARPELGLPDRFSSEVSFDRTACDGLEQNLALCRQIAPTLRALP